MVSVSWHKQTKTNKYRKN
uniref:Uncharacterized protein n=1 Tax=Romanomermis culicivorax TaxID=13658 RepID=A0A915HM42_ROMCU